MWHFFLVLLQLWNIRSLVLKLLVHTATYPPSNCPSTVWLGTWTKSRVLHRTGDEVWCWSCWFLQQHTHPHAVPLPSGAGLEQSQEHCIVQVMSGLGWNGISKGTSLVVQWLALCAQGQDIEGAVHIRCVWVVLFHSAWIGSCPEVGYLCAKSEGLDDTAVLYTSQTLCVAAVIFAFVHFLLSWESEDGSERRVQWSRCVCRVWLFVIRLTWVGCGMASRLWAHSSVGCVRCLCMIGCVRHCQGTLTKGVLSTRHAHIKVT